MDSKKRAGTAICTFEGSIYPTDPIKVYDHDSPSLELKSDSPLLDELWTTQGKRWNLNNNVSISIKPKILVVFVYLLRIIYTIALTHAKINQTTNSSFCINTKTKVFFNTNLDAFALMDNFTPLPL
jgi:hypothetical protein